MISRFVDNWPYKLAAVVIAIALRFYVAAQLNPHLTWTRPINVTGIPSNLVLGSPLGSVHVGLSGPSADLETLRPSDIVADVDLSNARPGKTAPMPISIELNHDLPPDVRGDVKLDGPNPSTVVATLEPLITQSRNVHVHFDRAASPGSMYGIATLNPSTVVVQARQDVIDKIDLVTVDVVAPDEVPGTVQNVITGDFDVVARGADGFPLNGVIVNPAQVHVTVPLLKAASTKVVSVNTAIFGSPAAGGRVATATVTPTQVTLSGSPDALAKVGSVMTRPVDVGGARGVLTRRVDLVIPSGISRVGSDQVTVEVTIESLPSDTTPKSASPSAVTH